MSGGINAPYVSIHGRRLGLGKDGELRGAGGDVKITSSAVQAAITVGAAAAGARPLTVQLKDIDGIAIDHNQEITVGLYADALGAGFATTGGSTGTAIGANGSLLTLVTKKLFLAVCDTTGLLTLTWTDNASEVAFLGVTLPNGRRVFSAALTI